MSKPTHTAYIVNQGKDKDGNPKSYWREVGAVWPHKNGDGFDLVLFDQLAVSGRVTCTQRKEKPETIEPTT